MEFVMTVSASVHLPAKLGHLNDFWSHWGNRHLYSTFRRVAIKSLRNETL